jgi:hypothetical protein
MFFQVFQSVTLDELARVVGLVNNIDADDVEPGVKVAPAGAAGTTEQVKQFHRGVLASRFRLEHSQADHWAVVGSVW